MMPLSTALLRASLTRVVAAALLWLGVRMSPQRPG